jgi:hypothetical protein
MVDNKKPANQELSAGFVMDRMRDNIPLAEQAGFEPAVGY